MSAEALARRMYAALATGDRDELDAVLDPDFTGRIAEGMPAGAGAHDGAAAMRRHGWGAIARDFAARAEPERFLPIEPDRLLVTGRYTGEGRGGGKLDAAFAHVLTVRGDRITALEQYTDTARWVAAAGTKPATMTCAIADSIAEIRLIRPDQGNAINVEFTRELLAITKRLAADRSVRAVLITGDGPLTVGGDLELFGDIPPEEFPAVLRGMVDDYHRAIERLTTMDAPLVVAARGAAAGGGLGLVCAADIVLAADDTVFALGYAVLGLTADGGTSWYLPRLLGLRKAQEMFLLNRRLTAAEALDHGLVTRLVPADELDVEARAVAAKLAAGPTHAFGGMRRLLRRGFQAELHDQLDTETEVIVDAARHPDAAEGLAAFTGRRRPEFTGNAPQGAVE